ncbi:MAG TPA: dockerin type I domain-containing protein [Gemmataceae bacterium]|nr:dockerin type I domain-containing protein [Gemmataceae bacterium]
MFTFRRPSVAQRPRRRSVILGLDLFEERVIPSVGIGVNRTSFGSNSLPPLGNSGSVGPNHYAQFMDGRYVVFDKAGNIVEQNTDATFWNEAGITTTVTVAGLSQPRIVYDVLTDRWFAMQINLAATGNLVLVGRSDTADPSGTWKALTYTASGQFGNFPTLGIDANGVYIGTANFINRDTPFPTGVTLTSIPKSDLLLATPTLANRTTFVQNAPGVTMGWAPQVVTNFNSSPTYASIVATDYNLFDQIDRTKITGTGGAGATLGTTSALLTSPTSLPGKSRQPDGTRQISGADDDRYTGASIQVGDLIYSAHGISVNASGQAVTANTTSTNAIHLVVIRDSTNLVVAQGTYFNSSYDYIYPSVAANQYGDIMIGFNRSGLSATDGQLGAYAVYARINPANPTSITFGQEVQLRGGQADNYHQQGGTLEPWGPYSATSVDPTNPLAFWTTQEFAQTDIAWGTQLTQLFVSPRAFSVSSTAANGNYGVGAVIPITISFNNAVTVTGSPQLALNSGGTAVYASGSGTSTLTFNYTVAAGQSTGDLDYSSASALSLNGGTITDAISGLDAELTLPAPGAVGSLGANKNISIDAAVASVTGVTSTVTNGTYGFGSVIPVTVTFNRPVVVTGSPQLALNSGGAAIYASGSGSSILTFNYTVGAGENAADLDYTSATALTLNGGTIKDQATTGDADLTLPAPGAAGSLGANKNIIIDAVAAQVTNVSSPTANGTYTAGGVIDVTVQFNKVVVVTGTPQLALNSGGTASYFSGSGTGTLTFRYTVAAGHNATDLDYTSTTALSLNGGTIQSGGMDASLALPAPGTAGSLGTNKNIVVDTSGPEVVAFYVLFGTKKYNLIGSTRFDLPWRITGIRVVFSAPIVSGKVQSLSGLTATQLTGLRTNTLTWRFNALTKGSFNVALASSGVNALKDSAGNAISPFSMAFKVLYGDFNDDGVVNGVDVTGIQAGVMKPYQLNSPAYNIFADLSGDGLVNLTDVTIAKSRTGQSLP